MKDGYDWIIVGGGVVGLSTAMALLKKFPKSSLAVFEKENDLGLHASGLNSGVLHAGFYYNPTTLKAKLCVAGSQIMKEYCEKNNLPLARLGKVVVPTDSDYKKPMETILYNARENGVKLELIGSSRLRQLEPYVSPTIKEAIHSPDSAVVSPKKVLHKMSHDIKNAGGSIFLNSRVSRIFPDKSKIEANGNEYRYGHLVNAAGCHADKVYRMVNEDRRYRILPFKGLYYELSKSSQIKVNGNIYPVPNLNVPFLGVHFTKSVSGEVHIGPTAIPALGRENYRGLTGIEIDDFKNISTLILQQYWLNNDGFRKLVHEESPKILKHFFYKSAKKLIPALSCTDLKPSKKVGIRAQLYDMNNKKLIMDYIVEKKDNSIHILNAVSPAFTSCFTFSKYLLDNYL
ncbi:MAG: L-2-hydroxyglutarate oxidase [Oligoflexales bacterium]|nr:L-2-hydroxyglutarate oxidase [Oligoflexales bacterium]